MSFLTLWLVVVIVERSIGTKHRSVNLALETVLQFDKADDINVINKVQGFLSQIQTLLTKKEVTDNVTRRNLKYKFTDFVEDVITTVKSFEDNDLKEVFRIIDNDLWTRRADNELIDDNARKFLSQKLTKIRNQPAINIRRDLDTVLRELRADMNKKSSYILDFVNSLYKRNSEKKLSKLIKRLNLFRRSKRKSKVVLKDIIDRVFNDLIYEHYNNLEDNERAYIRKFVKSYLIDDESTSKTLKIKQRAKVTEVTHESINTEERIDESKPTQELTLNSNELTAETLKDASKETTKKILKHITLYPKTIITEKIPKFRTGLPIVKMETIDEDTKDTVDKKYDEDTKEANEIFTNHSVEINVNLMLRHSRDSQDREDSQIVKSFRSKSTPHKVFLRAFKKKFNKNKTYHKSSTPALSIDTFGSLYKTKTPKKYNNKPIPFFYYNTNTTTDKYFKWTYIDDIVKKTSVPEEIHFVGDHRRVNKPINLNEDRVTKSAIRGIGSSRIEHLFTTRALTPLFILTNKVTTVVTTEKSTTKTSQSDDFNEIFDNENGTELKEGTTEPLLERKNTIVESVPKENTIQLDNYSINHNNNKTTGSGVSAITFDFNNFIKKSEILNFNDSEKKKQIEEKMKADFGHLLDLPSSNATTEGFTDIFKDLEDAFQI